MPLSDYNLIYDKLKQEEEFRIFSEQIITNHKIWERIKQAIDQDIKDGKVITNINLTGNNNDFTITFSLVDGKENGLVKTIIQSYIKP